MEMALIGYLVIGVIFATCFVKWIKPDEPMFAGVLWLFALSTWPMWALMCIVYFVGVVLMLMVVK